MIYIFIVLYCTAAFGIHGGEGITGINRQVRNLLCALPFMVVCWHLFGLAVGLACFCLAYGGVSLTFDAWPKHPYLWLIPKGMITCPFGGFLTLPIVYRLSYMTRYTNVLAEYASGTAYGLILVGLLAWRG